MGLATRLIEQARQLGRQYGEFIREARSVGTARTDPDVFHLREAAEAAFGHGWAERMKRATANREWTAESNTGAIDVTAFKAVIDELATTTITNEYEAVTSGVADLFAVVPSGDRPQGKWDMTEMYTATDDARPIPPGTEYPRTGFDRMTTTAPEPVKYGLATALTLETVKANDTYGFVDAKKEVGRAVGDYANDLRIRVVTGLVNNYVRNGTSYNTYLASGAWKNKVDDFDVTKGPSEFDRANQLFEQMVHPMTGRSIRVRPTAILTMGSQAFQIASAVRATEIRTETGSVTVVGANPLAGMPTPITDPEIRRIYLAESGLTATQVDSHIWYGDFKRAFSERQVEPFGVYEADESDLGSAGFFSDIVYAVKARYWGVPFVRDPMYVQMLRKLS